ncbi:MAG TPA: hypothetical protein VGD46_00745 [Rhizobacter sp.]
MRTLLLLLAFISASAHAQAVYRCGADGRSYSHTPCSQGRSIEVNDERSAQQRREASDVAARERGLADSLEQDRLARESQPRPGAARIDGRVGNARLAQVAEPLPTNGKTKTKAKTKRAQHADRRRAASATRS